MEFNFEPPEVEEVKAADMPVSHYRPSWVVRDKLNRFKKQVEGQEKTYQVNYIRELCKRDLYYLCHEVLEYKDLEEPLHNDMCNFISTVELSEKNSLILIPRGHFKSTIATVGRVIQWILRDQDTRIGLFSGDMKNARKFATEIRNQLANNEKLKTLFPEILFADARKESPQWTADEFVVKRTSRGTKQKEGTVKIFGLLQNIPTGDHYDHLIGDDIVDQMIVQSEDQMEKIADQLQYLIPLQQTPDDPIHLVGTRYHVRDAYAKLLEDPFWNVYLRRDIEDGKLIFPGRFTADMLERTRMKIGNYKYQCQYKLDPQDPADKKFQMNWLNYAKPFIPHPEGNPHHSFILVVDPANKQKKSSDFTAMVVLAIDYHWNIHLVDGLHDKINPKERIDAVFRLCKKWFIHRVVYETIAFQDTDSFWIKRRQKELGQFFEIIEVAHRKQNKFDFIMSSQPVFQQGRFFLPNKPIPYKRLWANPDDGFAETVDIVEVFERQYDLFPNLDHDDMIDDVAMGLRAVTSGYLPRPEKAPTDFVGAYKENDKGDDNYDPMTG